MEQAQQNALRLQQDLANVDYLRIYFGDPYAVNDKIVLRQPSLGEIMAYGERDYWSLVYTLTAIPSDFKPELFDKGIDYEAVSDLEFFHMLSNTLPPEKTSILFGDIDLTKLRMYRQKNNDELVLYDADSGVRIDRRLHMIIQGYLTTLHNIKKKVEHAGNFMTKQIMIEDDRQRKKRNADKPWRSTMLPLISAMVNHPGFKYNAEQVRDLKLFAFMDSVARIASINTSNLLLQGAYAGKVDMKKVDKKSLDWMRDLYVS